MNHRSARIYIILTGIIIAQSAFLFFNQNTIIPREENIRFIFEAKKDENFFVKSFNDPVALFTLVLTCFTGGLFLATRNLWTATKDLVKGSDRSSEYQLRSYVSIVEGRVTLVPPPWGFIVRIDFQNSGQTPAYKFLTRIEGNVYGKSETPFRRVPPNETNQASVLGPGGQVHIETESTFISPEDLELVRKKEKAILIWGSAEYQDIFGVDRYFVYRLRMFGPEIRYPDGALGWPLKPHPIGYEAN